MRAEGPRGGGSGWVGKVESWDRCTIPLYVVLVRTRRQMARVRPGPWFHQEFRDPRFARELYKGRGRSRRGLTRSRIVGG